MAVHGRTRTKESRRARNLTQALWRDARRRALKKNLPFTIEPSDIVVPEVCPVFGVVLSVGGNQDWSPTLDRILPDVGYTQGNIIVVSGRANRIKSDATAAEIKLVAEFYAKLLEKTK